MTENTIHSVITVELEPELRAYIDRLLEALNKNSALLESFLHRFGDAPLNLSDAVAGQVDPLAAPGAED